MLNKDREINRKQLHWKFRPEDGLMYKQQPPWEEWSEEFQEWRVEYDALWRSGLAYIAYGDKDIKQGILNCFRPYIIGERRNPEKTMYQASRASNRFGEDDVSRDQIILALASLEFNGDIEEVKEITSKLSFRLSRRFLMTPVMYCWVKYLATRKQSWKNAYAIIQTLELLYQVPLTKLLRWLSGANKPIPLPHTQFTKVPYKKGIIYKIYQTIGYHEYGLHFAAWRRYVTQYSGILGKLTCNLMSWQMEESNLLFKIIIKGETVSNKEIEDFKSTNTFMWQRRNDVVTAWIYELQEHKVEFNDLEKDILKRLLETKE